MTSYNEAALAEHERQQTDADEYNDRVEAKTSELIDDDDWCATFESDLAGNAQFMRESYRLLRTDPCEYGRVMFAAMYALAKVYAVTELDREDRADP